MSQLQYIGARYVPKFYENPNTGDMTWKSNVNYEALTIVKYNDDTYTSKKPVPSSVGNPAANSDYWAKTADFNAALQNLQQELGALEAIVGDTPLDTTAQNVTDAINELHTDVNSIGNDAIIVAASYGIKPSVSDNCIVYLKALFANTFENIYSASQGGVQFGNGTYQDVLETLENQIDNPSKVKAIFVIGFSNDINNTWTNTKNGMIDFRTYAAQQYPNANVILSPVSQRSTHDAIDKMFTLYKNILNTRNEHGFAVQEDIYHIMSIDPSTYVDNDGVHPTTAGAKFIATAIFNSYVGSGFNYLKRHGQTSSSLLETTDKTAVSVVINTTMSSTEVQVTVGVKFTMTADKTVGRNYSTDNYPIVESTYVKSPSDAEIFYGKYSQALISDLADGSVYGVKMASVYNSGADKYYWSIVAGTSDSLTLTNGHTYRLEMLTRIPFLIS